MIRLFGFTGSGNCWKPATLMEQLGTAFEWINPGRSRLARAGRAAAALLAHARRPHRARPGIQ